MVRHNNDRYTIRTDYFEKYKPYLNHNQTIVFGFQRNVAGQNNDKRVTLRI